LVIFRKEGEKTGEKGKKGAAAKGVYLRVWVWGGGRKVRENDHELQVPVQIKGGARKGQISKT